MKIRRDGSWLRVFLFFIFSPPIIFSLYDIFFYFLPLFVKNYSGIDPVFLTFMVFCDTFGILSLIFLMGFFKKRKIKIYSERIHKSISILIYYSILLFVFLLFNFLVYSVFDSLNYLEVFYNYHKFYALSKRGTAWVFIIINMFIFVMIFDLYKIGYNKHKVNVFIATLVILAMTGGRSLVIVLLSFVFFLFIVIHRNNVKFKVLFFTVLLSLLIFLGNGILRATDLETYLSSKSATLDFDNAFILEDVIKFTENNSSYFVFVQDFIYMFIPRYFMPEKPMSTAETRLVYPEVAEYGTNYTFGIYANAIMNFKYLFIIIIPVYVFFMNFFYIKYVYFPQRKTLKSFIVVFFLFYSIQFVRGGIFNSRLVIVLISILMAYAVYVCIPKRKHTFS